MVIEVAPQRPASDAEVIARSVDEPTCFFELFDRHYRSLHRFLRARGLGDAADDLAAETFVVAFRRRSRYDGAHAEARAWLFGIAINLARNAARADRRRLRAVLRLAERPSDPGEELLDRVTAGSLPLAEALAELSAEERDTLLLHACEGLSYDEVAEALAVPVGTVRSRLHRARSKVRARLELYQERGDDDAR